MNALSAPWPALLLALLLVATPVRADKLVLGVFDSSPPQPLQPQVELLAQRLAGTTPGLVIELRVLPPAALDAAIAANQVDLLLTTPAHYIRLRSRSALTGVLATLVRQQGNTASSSLGGVILTRPDSGVRTLADLRGRVVAAPRVQGVGSFQAQAFEMLQAGVPVPAGERLRLVDTSTAAVAELLQRRADAVFMRTGMFEDLLASGRRDLAQLQVVNEQRLSGYPWRLSTRLYPEWALLALPHVDARLVRRVAANALSIDPDEPAARAAGIAGFDPPADYLPAEQLARALQLPPYDRQPPLRLFDLWQRNRVAVLVGGVSLLAIATLLGLLLLRNRQLASGNLALARSRRLLQTVLDTVPVRVFWKNLDLRFGGANAAFAADLRLNRPADVEGKDDFELAVTDDAERFRAEDLAVIRSGQSQLRFDSRRIDADGHELWLRTSKVPLRDESGAVVGVLGVYDDITELRRRQQEIVSARNQLQATLDAVPDLLFEIDLEGRYHSAHSPRPELLASPLSTVVGSTIHELLPPAVVAVVELALHEALADGTSSGHVYHLDLPLGRRWFELSAARKAGHDDGPPRFVLLSRDVTERTLAEAELQRHRLHLEDLVSERTTELRAARDAAEAASRSKSAFLANMSHEIRTPLNAVLGMAHLLRRSTLTAQQQGWVRSLQQAGEHLLEVLNAVLDLSKIEAGKFTLDEAPLDLAELVDTACAMVRGPAQDKGLALHIQLPAQRPALVGDATRLQQALLNLLNNAVKFTPRGSVTLRASLADDTPGGVLLRMEVQDTGIGVDPQVLPRLFQAFEQADSSLARSFGGTGLGLAITRRLAQLMGGQAGASSTPGVGSTFWFTARLRHAPAALPPAQPAANGDAEQQLRQQHRGRRVLVAEDDAVNRELAFELLQVAGLQVDLALDGEQAVAMAAARRYDAVLMDMQMPRLDGLQATQRLRSLPQAADVPVIALTANAFAEDRQRCLAAGMNDFIAKPLDADTLYATLLRWLR